MSTTDLLIDMMEKATREGEDAAESGMVRQANPYRNASDPRREAWFAGYDGENYEPPVENDEPR